MGAAKEPPTEPVINLSSNSGLPPQWCDNSSAREDSADSKSSSSKQTRPKRSLSKHNQHDGQPYGGTETTSSNVRMLNTPPLPVEATSPNTLKLPFKKPLLQDELAACTTQLFKQALSTNIVHEVVKEQQVDIDTSATEAVTYLSDSSPPPVLKKYEPTQAENELASLLLGTADPPEGDLTPHLDTDLRHITADKFTFDNAFVLVLATPEAWISNLVI
ncbi:unnamed protein product [Cochlearia groenlandica]